MCQPVIHIVIESAVLFTLLSAIALTLFALDNTGLFFVFHIIPPIVGINFSAIIIRTTVGFGENLSDETSHSIIQEIPLPNRARFHRSQNLSANNPLKVSIVQHVEDDYVVVGAGPVHKSPSD